MLDLEVIRQRNKALYRSFDFSNLHSDYDAYVMAESFLRGDVGNTSAANDIDALLAEVERLRAAASCADCFLERYYNAGTLFCDKHHENI